MKTHFKFHEFQIFNNILNQSLKPFKMTKLNIIPNEFHPRMQMRMCGLSRHHRVIIQIQSILKTK